MPSDSSLPTDRGLHQIHHQLNVPDRVCAQCEQLVAELPQWISRTETLAPLREAYVIDRTDVGGVHVGSDYEIRLERSLWNTFRHHRFLDVCPGLASYSVGLFNQQQQNDWGEVDLLGRSGNNTPVVIELKQATGRNPLSMIVQGLAYAIAIRKAWKAFRPSWVQAVGDAPDSLGVPLIVGLAPTQYWDRFMGSTASEFDSRHWHSIRNFLTAVENNGFQVRLASFSVADDSKAVLPAVSDARVLEIPHIHP